MMSRSRSQGTEVTIVTGAFSNIDSSNRDITLFTEGFLNVAMINFI